MSTQLDESKLHQFVGQVVSDLAAAMGGVMTNLGHKLGLYQGLARGPSTAAELAERTGTNARSVQEWLDGQRAAGYVTFDPKTGCYALPPEHACVLASKESPVFLVPAFDAASSLWHDEDKIAQAFRSGEGLPWGHHHCRLFSATEAFYGGSYRTHLVKEWLPALEATTTQLEAGGRVADIGCGHGASTILMAQAFPRARFVGLDSHEESVAVARLRAQEAGVSDRVQFQRAAAETLSENGVFDLICFMDALHDMGEPLEAARRCRAALTPEGTLMLVEPFAHDDATRNVGPVARMYYAASAGICTQNALAQGGRFSLGAQAGAARLGEILKEAGFRRVRTAARTPFNLIIEARP